jgi:hypothetical protein
LDEALRQKITLEIENVDRLFAESKPLFDLCKLRQPDFVEASAVALILHSFYKEYLTFRHFIRHSYAYSIDATRLQPLILNAVATWNVAKQDMLTFLASPH